MEGEISPGHVIIAVLICLVGYSIEQASVISVYQEFSI